MAQFKGQQFEQPDCLDRAGLGEPDTSFGGYNPRGRGTRGHEGPGDMNFDFRTFMNFLAENQTRGQLARSFTPMPPRKL